MAEIYKREVAHRLFAQEFRDSQVQLQGEGERDPSYVVTPLGAKVNRLHVVGVCTEVEPVGESGEVYRARISDPTGVFTLYAGQYQPEAAQFLSELKEFPSFVAVTGKARTFEPEPGKVVTSIRPETISAVDRATRDQWILDAARRTKERLDEAGTQGSAAAQLVATHYEGGAMARYRDAASDALHALVGGEVPVHRIEAREADPDDGVGGDSPTWTPPPSAPAKDPEAEAAQDAVDDAILAIVARLAGSEGARWDDILSEASSEGSSGEEVEESLNRLMDKGLVYEPTLGVLKTT